MAMIKVGSTKLSTRQISTLRKMLLSPTPALQGGGYGIYVDRKHVCNLDTINVLIKGGLVERPDGRQFAFRLTNLGIETAKLIVEQSSSSNGSK